MSVRMKIKKQPTCLTIVEVMIIIVIGAALVWVFIPYLAGRVTAHAQQSKQVNNLRGITMVCHLYAQDNEGVFPTGTEPGSANTNANTILQDLFATGEIGLEALFWNPRSTHVCAPEPPNEDGTLDPGENAFDYISGLEDSSPRNLPLLVEAQTGENQWRHDHGHPREHNVVVAYVDASTAILETDRKTESIHVEHASGGQVHLLSISDEAGTTPGNLPAHAEVKHAAPPRGGGSR